MTMFRIDELVEQGKIYEGQDLLAEGLLNVSRNEGNENLHAIGLIGCDEWDKSLIAVKPEKAIVHVSEHNSIYLHGGDNKNFALFVSAEVIDTSKWPDPSEKVVTLNGEEFVVSLDDYGNPKVERVKQHLKVGDTTEVKNIEVGQKFTVEFTKVSNDRYEYYQTAKGIVSSIHRHDLSNNTKVTFLG